MVSDVFNLVANLLVKFNELVSDKLYTKMIRFDKETEFVVFNLPANLLVKFNELVSILLEYNT